MDLNLVLCIILGILVCFAVPIVCYIFCPTQTLNRLRYLFLIFYVLILFVGVTAKITIADGIISINYEFLKIWGNKEMFWGFENLTFLTAILNLVMFVPLGAFVASNQKTKPNHQTLTVCAFVGLLCSLLIETLQYALPVDRVVEFSDTVLNTLSAVLGGLMILSFKNVRQKVQKSVQNDKKNDA